MAAAQKTPEDLEREEMEAFTKGPLSVLTTSVKTNCQVGHLRRSEAARGLARARAPSGGREGRRAS